MGSGSDPPQQLQLVDLAAKYCMANLPQTLSTTSDARLREGITLPTELCEKLLEASSKDESFNSEVVPLFEDRTRTRLQNLALRNSTVTDSSLQTLLCHNPLGLDIHNCTRLTPEALNVINKYGQNLKSLVIGNSTQIMPETLRSTDGVTLTPEGETIKERKGIITLTNLRKFVIWNLHVQAEPDYWELLLSNFCALTHLDLSNCMEIDDLDFLKGAKFLVYLCLYNVGLRAEAFQVIGELKYLRHLDISQSSDNASIYRDPNETLAELVQSLPYLTSLDISGTNLAGRGVAEKQPVQSCLCDIPGLVSRVGTELEFLGLYGSHHDASHRHHIPAKRIAGDKNEAQILAACQAYLDRHEVLEKVLNDLFHLFRGEKGTEVEQSLDLILEAMSRHLGEKHVQISGSASLFYIVKSTSDKGQISFKMRKQILTTLINAMDVHKFDSTMMRNGCLTICLFKIPQDVMFSYEKLVRILLEILGGGSQEEFVERVAIYLLNSLACQVEGVQKKLVGDLGAIQKMLRLIQDRLSKNECDDVMEIAWSFLWNATDETRSNSEKFLNGNGMNLFLSCLRAFNNKPELLRNMMGLLGNVAEVQSLRPQLMTPEFIDVFYSLLDSTQDNIEVSYNAAGVLAHILSDGKDAWTIKRPNREIVLVNMSKNIKRWDINSPRNINYRSFEPILRLLTVHHTPVCQLWASWALANLTRVYPDKYCPLLEKENGLELLEPLKEVQEVGQFAALAFSNVELYFRNSKLDG